MKILGTLIVSLIIITSCAKKTTVAKEIPADVKSGQQIELAKCGKCHDHKKAADYTAAEWEPIMDKMAINAKLSADEKAQVLSYVKFYAKPQ